MTLISWLDYVTIDPIIPLAWNLGTNLGTQRIIYTETSWELNNGLGGGCGVGCCLSRTNSQFCSFQRYKGEYLLPEHELWSQKSHLNWFLHTFFSSVLQLSTNAIFLEFRFFHERQWSRAVRFNILNPSTQQIVDNLRFKKVFSVTLFSNWSHFQTILLSSMSEYAYHIEYRRPTLHDVDLKSEFVQGKSELQFWNRNRKVDDY